MGDPFYQTRGITPVHPHSATSTIMARGVPVKAKQAQKPSPQSDKQSNAHLRS